MLCEILDITQSRKLEGSFVLEKNLGRVRLVFFPLYRIVLTHDFKCIHRKSRTNIERGFLNSNMCGQVSRKNTIKI